MPASLAGLLLTILRAGAEVLLITNCRSSPQLRPGSSSPFDLGVLTGDGGGDQGFEQGAVDRRDKEPAAAYLVHVAAVRQLDQGAIGADRPGRSTRRRRRSNRRASWSSRLLRAAEKPKTRVEAAGLCRCSGRPGTLLQATR